MSLIVRCARSLRLVCGAALHLAYMAETKAPSLQVISRPAIRAGFPTVLSGDEPLSLMDSDLASVHLGSPRGEDSKMEGAGFTSMGGAYEKNQRRFQEEEEDEVEVVMDLPLRPSSAASGHLDDGDAGGGYRQVGG